MKTIKIQGKDYATFNGVLDEAHKLGLENISTKIVQLPNKENEYEAVLQASITLNGRIFQATGDASPINVNKMIRPHLIRMAETRAVGRALRFGINAPTLLEELMEENNKPQKRQIQTKPKEQSKLDKNTLEAMLSFIKTKGDPNLVYERIGNYIVSKEQLLTINKAIKDQENEKK